MFEKELQERLKRSTELQSLYQHAEDIITEANLSELEPLVAWSWLYFPTDSRRVAGHPDWPTTEWITRGTVHIHLYIPYEHKAAVRALCLASGRDWRKTYTVNNASYPRKVNYLEEHWTWSAEENRSFNNDEISIVLYRPVVEGEEVGGCKVVRHVREPSAIKVSELVISCEVENA